MKAETILQQVSDECLIVRDLNCRRCNLHAASKAVCVMGRGPTDVDIMLVGEALGGEEEQQGRPFVGPAGKILDGAVAEAGLEGKVYISNVVKCRPPGNRTPTKEEMAACRLYLGQEIELIQPKVIVALGATAAMALAGKSIIKQSRSQLLTALPQWRTGAPVLVTYHPAAMLHQDNRGGSQIREALVTDLKLAYTVVYEGRDENNVELGHPYTEKGREVISRFQRIIQDRPACELTCDLEWEVPEGDKSKSSLWPWANPGGIICVGLAARDPAVGQVVGISIPWSSEWNSIIQPSLTHPLIYHNAIADLIWLLGRYGDVGKPVGDSLVLASLLGYSSLGLKVLAPQVCGVRPGWEESVAMGATPTTIKEWSRLLTYNSQDAAYTLLLHDALLLQMTKERPQVEDLYRHLLLPAVYHMAWGGLKGLPMDLPNLQAMEREVGSIIATRKTEIEQVLGVPMKQKVRVAEAVERLTGVRLSRTPKLGRPSLNNDDLEQIDHPIAKALVGVAQLEKLHSTYLRPWAATLGAREDHRLHNIYRVTGASTGRTSAESESGGGVQQYPRSKKMRKLVRARDGWLILNADHSMLEIRIAAWLSREPQMIRFLREGVDIHRATAAWVKLNGSVPLARFVPRVSEYTVGVTKDERQGAKPVNFGLLYGGGAGVVVDSARKDYGINMSLAEAENARRGYFELYPGLIEWHGKAWESVRKGYVETPFGLIRNLAGLNEDPAALQRKAINTPVQGTASYISLLGLVGVCDEIRKRGMEEVCFITDFVHDNILGEVREDVVEEVTEIVRDQLEHPPLHLFGLEMDVPLVADIELKQTWGD